VETTCIFCRIARREVDAHVLYEDEGVLAFLDRGPIRPGHTQIIAKQHYPSFDETPADILTEIVLLGKKLAAATKQLYAAPRVAFLFTGGDVAHVHAHLVAMHEKTDITSRRYIVEDKLTFRAMPPVPEAELARIASELRQALASQHHAGNSG